MIDPMKGAVRYNHKSSNIPLSSAGATERIGFIEAPEIGDRKNTSRAMIADITVLIIAIGNFFLLTTIKMPPIKNTVAKISMP